MAEKHQRERPPAQAHLRFQAEAGRMRGLDLAARFQYIHDTNLWQGEESRSGIGSDLAGTDLLRQSIPTLLEQLGAKSLLDIPCGDFRWMSETQLGNIDYIGADILAPLIERNQKVFGAAKRRFMCLDLTRDALPPVDVVLCRDCLVHLSFANIFAALDNIRRSGSTYLLTTTFTGDCDNHDIEDGDWRMLKFEQPPFHFPAPLALIVEGCTEEGGAYPDKSLGLWRISDLP